jgi:hypothetical protein
MELKTEWSAAYRPESWLMNIGSNRHSALTGPN